MLKRWTAGLLALALLICLVPASAFADETVTEQAEAIVLQADEGPADEEEPAQELPQQGETEQTPADEEPEGEPSAVEEAATEESTAEDVTEQPTADEPVQEGTEAKTAPAAQSPDFISGGVRIS